MYIYIYCSSCEQGQQRQQPESPTSRTQPQAKAKLSILRLEHRSLQHETRAAKTMNKWCIYVDLLV